jgi:hypothetical protein
MSIQNLLLHLRKYILKLGVVQNYHPTIWEAEARKIISSERSMGCTENPCLKTKQKPSMPRCIS